MNNFNVISKKFYNQYRNGSTFTLNLTEFTDRLQGNTGEILQLVEVIEIATIVNEEKTIDITFNENSSGSFAILDASLLDFVQEGLYNGAILSIDLLGTTVTATCEGVTGSSNQELKIDSTGRTNLLGAGWEDGDINSDVVITITNHPTFLTYKYGINPNKSTTPNYLSPLDNNEQAYQIRGVLTGVASPMIWIGKEIGSNMGTVTLEHVQTVDVYKHQYEIVHTFKQPYYVDGQLSNINTQQNPEDLVRDNSLKYGNGFFFGGTTNITVGKFEDIGGVGNIGYFGENFNGFKGSYTSSDFLVTNSLNTGKLEATVPNTVTFKISSSTPIGFVGGETIILTHSKLPTQQEYANKTESFDNIWLFENIRQTENAAAVAGTMFSAVTVTLVGSDLEVSAVITYSADQQTKITDTSNAILMFNIATENIANPNTTDRGMVSFGGQTYSEDTRVGDLVTLWQPDIYNSWDFFSGSKFFTNFDGWDGDLIGVKFSFDLDVTQDATINSAKLFIVSDSLAQKFQISLPIPFASINVITETSGLYDYQLFNSTIGANLNLPFADDLGFINLATTTPAPSTPTQTWTGSLGIRVPWQDWIANNVVPNSFFDPSKPNNNKNQKTSNYDNGTYDIKLMLSLNLGSTGGVNTNYELYSDASTIADFDTNGGTFTGVPKFYDLTGDITDNVFVDQDIRVEIEFPHALGVLAVGDLWGRIWVEQSNATGNPFDLSTDKDWTNPLSPIKPSDTLSTGNTTLVEIVSINNLVTLICLTNKNNIINDVEYKFYGRLGNKL